MYREKQYICGNFLEVEIFPTPEERKIFSRKRKVHESAPAQRNLNDKKSQRYFVRLVHCNFTEKDLYVDLTYDQGNIPDTREEILRDVQNYVKRLQRHRKKQGLGKLQYIYVISNCDNNGDKVRYHVHMIINDMDRDAAEKAWGKGRANTDRLQFNETGVEGKSLYMARQAKGDRSWGSSIGLIKPEPLITDRRKELTRKMIFDMERCPEDRAIFEKLYENWTFTSLKISRDNDDGAGSWQYLIRMRRYI